MEKETLHFRIGLSGTYWDRPPQYSVLVNDMAVVSSSLVDTATEEVFYVEFDMESDVELNRLQIRLENKTPQDTVENADKTGIVKDMLLNIVSVEIDEIDLKSVIYKSSEYHVDEPVVHNGETVSVVKNCINLGWNGEWQFHWTNPFYLWLLEHI
jgi:hypothetical protein